MPQGNSLGIITGLALVGVLVIMIASIDRVARTVQGPSSSYELAGSSRPATLDGRAR
jgi:hypothetical protein